jgi:hypothetical protein
MAADCRIGLYQGRRPLLRRASGACPRCAAGRAASNSAEGDDVVERDHIVEGDSPFEEAAHRGGAGTAKPADIDEERYNL